MAKFAETIQAVSGVEAPKHRQPYPLAMLIISLATLARRITGRNLPVKPRDLRRMRYLQAPGSLKAKRILKVNFRPLLDSLRDTTAWFKVNGRV